MKFNSLSLISAAILSLVAFGSFTNEKNAEQTSNKMISCDTSDSPRRITINDEYSIEIPRHMKVATDLNADASLQYNDLEEELYIIVIDESTKEFRETFRNEKEWDENLTVAENYRKVQIANMKKTLKSMKGKPTLQKTSISKTPAEIVDFVGKVDGIDPLIYYKIGFLESDGKLYMIMTWTLNDMRSRHNTEMMNMIKSFRTE
jgi:hypothetical protein